MSQLEDIIREAARKLSAKYKLPTHIVEEDLVHDIMPFVTPVKPDDELPKDINIKLEIKAYTKGVDLGEALLEATQGGVEYAERQPSLVQVRDSDSGMTRIQTINLFLTKK